MLYASVGRRLMASLLDMGLVAVLGWAVVVRWGGTTGRNLVLCAAVLLVWEFAMAWRESRTIGGSWGKRRLRLRVSDEDAAPLGMRRSLVRQALKWAPLNLVGISILAGWFLTPVDAALLRPALHLAAYGLAAMGFFVMFFGPHSQALHDILARSLVLQRPPPAEMKEITPEDIEHVRMHGWPELH